MFSMIWALATVLGTAVVATGLGQIRQQATRNDWIQAAWVHFLERQKRLRPTDAQRVEWDRMMEAGELPPGYFFNLSGEAVPDTERLEPWTMMDPHTWESALGMSQHVFRERRSTRPRFYIDKAIALKEERGTQFGVEVTFDPPAYVRLMSDEQLHDLDHIDDFATDVDYMAPSWRVELLEERPELAGPEWRGEGSLDFEPFAIVLEEDDGDSEE